MYYYRRVPLFRPGKGHNFSQVVLFDSRLSVHSLREVENFFSVASEVLVNSSEEQQSCFGVYMLYRAQICEVD